LGAHIHEQLINNLTAGSGRGIHILFRSEGSGCEVMIDPKGNAAEILPVCFGEQMGRGDIHTDQCIGTLRCLHGHALQAAHQKGGGFIIVQNVGSFSQLPQSFAQSGSGADGISIRTGVG
jgi:hypothetical protein